MPKKGEIQFNWVFVLIAGAVILGFFINFTFKYIDLQNQKMGAKLYRNIDETFNLLLSNIYQRTDSIPLSLKAGIESACTNGETNFIVNGFSADDLSNKIIFSSSSFSSRNLDVWVNSWKYPFKIDNFFYISGDNIKYIIIGTNQKAQEIYSNLPESFKNNFDLNPSNYNNLDKYQEVRIIAIDSVLPPIDKPNIKKIKINTQTKKITVGATTTDYLSDEMLYGAIFSDNYDCLFNSAMKKLSKMSELYSKKASYLLGNPKCDYSNILSKLNNLKTAADQKNTQQIISLHDSIDAINRDLDSRGCSTIY